MRAIACLVYSCAVVLFADLAMAGQPSSHMLKLYGPILVQKEEQCRTTFKEMLEKNPNDEWTQARITRICQCQVGLIAAVFAAKADNDWLSSKIPDCVEFAKVMEEE